MDGHQATQERQGPTHTDEHPVTEREEAGTEHPQLLDDTETEKWESEDDTDVQGEHEPRSEETDDDSETRSHFSDSSSDEEAGTEPEEGDEIDPSNDDWLGTRSPRNEQQPDSRTQLRIRVERERHHHEYFNRSSRKRPPIRSPSPLRAIVEETEDILPVSLTIPEPGQRFDARELLQNTGTTVAKAMDIGFSMILFALVLVCPTLLLATSVSPVGFLHASIAIWVFVILLMYMFALHKALTILVPEQEEQEEQDVAQPVPSPATPASPEMLELMTGISIEEGKERLARLIERARRTRSDDANALQIKRQALKYGESFRHSGRFDDSILPTDQFDHDPEIAALWASAIAHGYRAERDRSRQEVKERDEEIEQLRANRDAWQNAAESQEKEVDRLRHNRNEWKQRAEMHQKSFERIRPMAMIERRRREAHEAEKDGTADALTQTDPIDIEWLEANSNITLSSTPSPNGNVDATTQINEDDLPLRQLLQTRPASSRTGIPPLRLDAKIRSRVVSHIVNWMDTTHRQSNGPSIDPLSVALTDALLNDGETTFEDFVEALVNENFMFRPDHLAGEIERLVRPLGRVPLGILFATRRLSQFNHNVSTLLDEIAGLQQDRDNTEAERIRVANTHPGLVGSSDVQIYEELSDHIAAQSIELDQQFQQNQALQTEIDEYETTLKAVVDNTLGSPTDSASGVPQVISAGDIRRKEIEIEELSRTRKALSEAYDEARAENWELTSLNNSLTTSNVEQQSTIKDLQNTNADLQRRIEHLEVSSSETISGIVEPAAETEATIKQSTEDCDIETENADSLAEKNRELSDLCDALTKSRNECEHLNREKQKLREDSDRLLNLLKQYKDHEEEKRRQLNHSSRPTPTTPRLPDSYVGPDDMLTPRPLPAANARRTPPTPVSSVLNMPDKWSQRERQIRKTTAFEENRRRVLEHFAELEQEPMRAPGWRRALV